MADTIERLLGEFDRILTADGHVPRVEAETDIAAFEHHVDVVLGLHHGLDVGVQDLVKAVLGADVVDDPEHLHQVLALIRGERARHGPVEVEDDGRDELRRARTLEEVGDTTGLVDAPLAHRGVMQHDGCEAADKGHVVRRELGLDVLR